MSLVVQPRAPALVFTPVKHLQLDLSCAFTLRMALPPPGTQHERLLATRSQNNGNVGHGCLSVAVTTLLHHPAMLKSVTKIINRSERQQDLDILERTYVETGVMPQLDNPNNQILFGRRGTGKSHVLRVLGAASGRQADETVLPVYVDVRLLGSAQMMADPSAPMSVRCTAVFRDMLGLVQGALLDRATTPGMEGGLEEVSALADAVSAQTADVASRKVTLTEGDTTSASASVSGEVAFAPVPKVKIGGQVGDEASTTGTSSVEYVEVMRETVVFAEVAGLLDEALRALGMDRLLLLIDEWAAIPREVQPYVAEIIKRSLFPASNITIKIASLEYRSNFAVAIAGSNSLGFELSGDLAANLDLDDYYVFERNPTEVVATFEQVLLRHIEAVAPDNFLAEEGVTTPTSLRSRLFTAPETFTELVRAGEGVVRDFLGIFTSAFFRARRSGLDKIDKNSVEEAARDWFETDKSANLDDRQRAVLEAIMTDVIGSRQARMFMLARQHADHPMIQSLFDMRIVHLVFRGYSDKQNPGLRYNIYALDYGTYVDLKRTKSEPEDSLDLDAVPEVDREDRVVPFADKRSIRRVILSPKILDATRGT